MALPVRRRPGLDEHGAVTAQLHRAVLAAGHAGGAVDEHREPDAEQLRLAGVTPLLLLGPDGVVVGVLERHGEGTVVGAAVVGEPGRAQPRELLVGKEVASPDLGGVHPDLGREQVDGPVDEGTGLRTAGAPVGHQRGGVRHHALVRPRDVGDVVRPRQEGTGVVGHVGGHEGIGAGVGDHVDLEAGDGPVAPAADADLLALGPGVAQADHVVRSRRHPADGPARAPGQQREQHVLRVGPGLGAEAASDVGGDHPDLFLLEAVEARQDVPHRVGPLAGGVLDEAPVHPVRRGHPGLDRARSQPLVEEDGVDHDLAVVERQRLGGPALVADDPVRARLREQQHLVTQGVLHPHDGRQRLVVDLDQVGRVGHRLGRLPDDGHDGLAHEPHPVRGQDLADHRLIEGRAEDGQGAELDVGRGQHVHHAGDGPGLGHVDAAQEGMGRVRGHEADVEGARQVEVADVGGVAFQQPCVLDATH